MSHLEVIDDFGKSSVLKAVGLSSDWEVMNKSPGCKLLFQESWFKRSENLGNSYRVIKD